MECSCFLISVRGFKKDMEKAFIFISVFMCAILLGFSCVTFHAIHTVNVSNNKKLTEASEQIEEYRAKKETLIKKAKKKDAAYYVDGVKQDTDGLNLDDYKVEYNENKLYFKKVEKVQNSTKSYTNFMPLFLPIFH